MNLYFCQQEEQLTQSEKKFKLTYTSVLHLPAISVQLFDR